MAARNKVARRRPGVQGTSGWAVIGRGQAKGVPEKGSSTGASNTRDWESICKTQKVVPFDVSNET
jgi:hypothetical protein